MTKKPKNKKSKNYKVHHIHCKSVVPVYQNKLHQLTIALIAQLQESLHPIQVILLYLMVMIALLSYQNKYKIIQVQLQVLQNKFYRYLI